MLGSNDHRPPYKVRAHNCNRGEVSQPMNRLRELFDFFAGDTHAKHDLELVLEPGGLGIELSFLCFVHSTIRMLFGPGSSRFRSWNHIVFFVLFEFRKILSKEFDFSDELVGGSLSGN